MNNKKVDIICLCLTAVLFGGTALCNIFQPDRPTVSEYEKRELASMPKFSLRSLADGSFFSGISSFVSDTFVQRDHLVELSRKMDLLKGFDYTLNGEDSFMLLNPLSADSESDDPDEDELSAAFQDLFNDLENQDKETTSEADETVIAPQFTDLPETEPAVAPIEPEKTDDKETLQETEPPDTDPSEPEETIQSSYTVKAINLSCSSIEMTVGGVSVVSATVETDNPDGATVYWSTTDINVVSVSINPSGGVDVKANGVGSCTLICSYSDTVSAECAVTVSDPPEIPEPADTTQADDQNPTPQEYTVTAIHLSRKTLNLTVGSGALVTATVDTDNPDGATVFWSTSDENIVSVTVNPKGGVDVRANSVGSCTVTCYYDDTVSASCTVNVSEIGGIVNPDEENLRADFLTNGLFIYGEAVYNPAYYSASSAKVYAQTAAYYQQLFGCRVSVVVAPVSSMVIDNPEVTAKIADQGEILDKMSALTDESVNFVDTYSKLFAHRQEYLFFKSDHHWTARGAYYAYAAFAESAGLKPTPLDGFDNIILNEHYHGSMYSLTRNPKVKNFEDVIEAYIPRKQHTMTVTNANGDTNVYNSSIIESYSSYLSFIAGDNPYTVINVPENPQDMNVLVLKDSYGDAFVPFLCEHYGNIIVIDVRYTGFNIYEKLKDYGLTDIIFLNNIQSANSYSWPKMYMSAVGKYLP